MAPSARRSDGLVVDLAMIAVVLMWSSTFTLFKIAWHDIDPVAFTSIRFGSMVVFSLVVLAFSRDRVPIRRQDLKLIVASGLTGYFLDQMGFVLGLDRTTAVASGVLIATHPIFSVLFLWLSGSERPRWIEVTGVLIGFVGVAVFLHVWKAVGHATAGDLLSLGAAAAFGAYGVITRPLARRYPSKQMMASSLAVGGTLIALVGIPAMVHQDWTAVRWPAWIIVAYAVVGPVYVAYALWNWAIARRGVPRTVVFGFLTPVLGGALAVAVLGEHVGVVEVFGAVLVVAGLVVTRLGGSRAAQAGAEPVVPDREPASA